MWKEKKRNRTLTFTGERAYMCKHHLLWGVCEAVKERAAFAKMALEDKKGFEK